MNLDRSGPERVRAGTEILEWIVVTAILTVAIYAILQSFGASLDPILQQVIDLWRKVLQRL